MYFWLCERTANIHPYANVSFPFITSKLEVKIKYFCVQIEKYFVIIHILGQTQHLESSFTHIIFFTKMLIFSYNSEQIHPIHVTVQYFKKYSFCPESINKHVRSYFGFQQKSVVISNSRLYAQFSQKDLETCERVANIFLHPGANYTYTCMYNL